MTSLVARLPAHSLRLGAAAVLAATALVGTTTSTVADPATARASPKKTALDRAGLELCEDIVIEQRISGDIGSSEEFEEALQACCELNGGEVVLHDQGWDCQDPADDAPAQLPRFPELGDVTATLTPAPSPPPSGPTASPPSAPPVQSG